MDHDMKKINQLILLGISYKFKFIKPMNLPYQFTIEPTNICNFQCVFCPQSDPSHNLQRKQGYLTLENMRLFLKKLRDVRAGNKNISLTLDGEPTLNEALPDFIRLINYEGLFPRFSTNARTLTPELFEKLAVSGQFLVSVDFASDAEYFEGIRGKRGDYELILENLRYIIDYIKRNPKIRLEITDISNYSGADPEKSLETMRKLFTYDRTHNIIFLKRNFHNFCGHLGLDSHNNNYRICPYPWTMFAVTWNGDVVACCRDTRAKTIMGNVFEQSIPEIWNGKEYRNIRTKLINKDLRSIAACKDCDLPWSSGTSRWRIPYILSSLLRR